MSIKKKHIFFLLNLFTFLFLSISCSGNNPYPKEEKKQNIYYDVFSSEPKHLDPALSYSSDEYRFLNQIYEPLLQYHYLKRPYELIPLVAKTMPQVQEQNGKYIYTIYIKKNIFYANHPAFLKNKKKNKDTDGYTFHLNKNQSFSKQIIHPKELLKENQKATKEVTVDDYIYQIKRMTHPSLPCPIFSILVKYIDGFVEFQQLVQKEIQNIRAIRKKKAGFFYNQELDEKENPIYIDLRKFSMNGLKKINDYTFQIILKKKYPQFKYWLAMPFFSPVPWQADRFYLQKASVEQNITIDRFPVGTGAYELTVNRPNYRMVLEKNSNYHNDFYPDVGSLEDKKNHLLDDANKKLPFIKKAIYILEKESIPGWIKFMQGYYDSSGIQSDVFDSAINIASNGAEVTSELKALDIRLMTSIQQSISYYAFNMADDIVGGYSIKKQKLRQAISIALNIEEFIRIYLNGRGEVAMSPLPPGIFGYNKNQFNPFVYEKNKNGNIQRKNLDKAKKLLIEAGYPQGINTKTGKRLVLFFDATGSGASAKPFFDWLRKQFESINVDLQIRSTDYNQFRSKVMKGNYQILRWGWNADYPDPENFLFLLYGKNGKKLYHGENAANYNNPKFNQLFKEIEVMPNNAIRLQKIQKMIHIAQQDAPWIWGFYPVGYGLYHPWYKNAKPMTIGGNTLKYKRIDTKKRDKLREKRNHPIYWPIFILGFIFVLLFIPAIKTVVQRERGEI